MLEETNHSLQWIFFGLVIIAIFAINPIRRKIIPILAKAGVFIFSFAIVGRGFVVFGIAENSQFPSNPTMENILHFVYLWGSIFIGALILSKSLNKIYIYYRRKNV